MVVGFMMARSHDLVSVEVCPVLAPGLARAPSVAQLLANRLGSSNKPLDIQLTASEAGTVRHADAQIEPASLERVREARLRE